MVVLVVLVAVLVVLTVAVLAPRKQSISSGYFCSSLSLSTSKLFYSLSSATPEHLIFLAKRGAQLAKQQQAK